MVLKFVKKNLLYQLIIKSNYFICMREYTKTFQKKYKINYKIFKITQCCEI